MRCIRCDLLCAILCYCFLLSPLYAIELYVSNDGSDQASGAIDHPLKTLEGARDVLRERRGQNPEPSTIYVREGVYSLSRTLELDERDSAVAFRGYQKEKPVLTGCLPIHGFSVYKGQILKADAWSQGFKDCYFRNLYLHGRRQILARYPNLDPENPYHGGWAYVDASQPEQGKRIFRYKEKDARAWSHPEDGEAWIFPRHNYWNRISSILSIDAAQRTITLAQDRWEDWEEILPGDRYFAQNLLEELDAPGEWYLDKRTGTLFFWPPEPLKGEPVYAPILESLVRISSSKDLAFSGFVFDGAEGTGIDMKDTENCLISASTIRNMGSSKSSGDNDGCGVRIDGGKNNGVKGCDIYETGSHGVLLKGGDGVTLTPASQFAENNYIHHVGVYYKQGLGISIAGCGNRASRNLIHDGPRMGILYEGNLNVVEYNHIRHMNIETDDSGAIYTKGRDRIVSRGSVIRFNYVHDMLGYGWDDSNGGAWKFPNYCRGIYLDDFASGVDIIGNIVVRCPGACIFLHDGSDNIVKNNIVAGTVKISYQGALVRQKEWTDCYPGMLAAYKAVSAQPAWKNMRSMELPPDKVPLPNGMHMRNNVCVQNIICYVEPQSYLYEMFNVPLDNNVFDKNLIWNKSSPRSLTSQCIETGAKSKLKYKWLEWTEWTAKGLDANSLLEDPLFVAPEKDDYRLKSESPAFKLGFERIPVEMIGPYEDPSRASWPIKEAEGIREVMERKGVHPFASQ